MEEQANGRTTTILHNNPLSLLQSVFGFQAFRGRQAEVIEALCSGRDALVLMPTGGGKSLCYQIPALIRPGVAVVVSPLIALMEDQVSALVQNGVRAAYLNSSLPFQAVAAVEQQLLRDELDLVYIAPERLLTEHSLGLFSKVRIALFAIDEAHCVSQWGHDFRQDYLQLSMLHERFPGIPRIALTATADELTRKEIIARLGLENAELFISGFDRPNIKYRVSLKDDAKQRVLKFLKLDHSGEAGIIYCLSRRKVDEIAAWLREQGLDALPYHAGMEKQDRSRNQRRFLMEEGVIMVATIAFGMGIDKPNVRFVVHLDLPKSIEAYYQETGRAGRDGLPAEAWLFYGLQDVVTLRQMLEGSDANEHRKRVERQKLDQMLGFCELTACRRVALLNYFGEEGSRGCGNCDNCLEPVATWDGTEAARMALSCIYRTGQRFGVNYLVGVLLGKPDSRIQKFGHDRQSTYGIGKDLGVDEWRSLFRQLAIRGLIDIDFENFGALRLNAASRPVLRGEYRLLLRKDRKKQEKGIRRPEHGLIGSEDQGLWEKLREERLKIAREQGLPPYIIFHDTTLREMAETKPVSLSRMAALSGVGEQKLAKYGERFIRVIDLYLAENPAREPSDREQ
ncbi:MAG: DNA helicase RecQ [Methylococcaceae bacterium]|nr:DNA helicase RecQ [Methylococcaceae bacterium]